MNDYCLGVQHLVIHIERIVLLGGGVEVAAHEGSLGQRVHHVPLRLRRVRLEVHRALHA